MALLELNIRNFAIIKQLEIEVDDGLTIVTGETGAGKSIVLDALNLLLGSRAETDMIRHMVKNNARSLPYFQLLACQTLNIGWRIAT